MSLWTSDEGTSRNDDLGYPIYVGDGLRTELSALARDRGKPALVLCDGRQKVRELARKAALALGKPELLGVPLGESRKGLATIERVLEAMTAAGVERSSWVAGVGGGVASDAFGFACATYMRGVAYAHVATTLVAMVDAAIGGKTGVNLRGGKNLAGVFRDPVAVFCDVSALRTLPQRSLREGVAEIVKAAIIEGGEFFEALEALGAHPMRRWPWPAVVAAAVKVKTMTVADDRLEAGRRETLNLGHTFAHAIERASEYGIAHGAAVSLGLRAAGLLAQQRGTFEEREHLRVLALLALLGLPLQTTLDPGAILAAMRADKKRRDGRLRFVLPRAIGDVEYGVECDTRSVLAALRRLQRPPARLRARR